jgi:hypothetical protein
VYALVHNLDEMLDLPIRSIGAVARSPRFLTPSEGPGRLITMRRVAFLRHREKVSSRLRETGHSALEGLRIPVITAISGD